MKEMSTWRKITFSDDLKRYERKIQFLLALLPVFHFSALPHCTGGPLMKGAIDS
jgi:hypothetical protein